MSLNLIKDELSNTLKDLQSQSWPDAYKAIYDFYSNPESKPMWKGLRDKLWQEKVEFSELLTSLKKDDSPPYLRLFIQLLRLSHGSRSHYHEHADILKILRHYIPTNKSLQQCATVHVIALLCSDKEEFVKAAQEYVAFILKDLSSYDSLRSAIKSLSSSPSEDINSLISQKVEEYTKNSLSCLQELKKKYNIPLEKSLNIVDSGDLHSITVFPREALEVPLPASAATYHKFVDDNKLLRKKIEVFCLEDVTVSFSKDGSRYVFNSDNELIEDFSRGSAPFLADTIQEIQGSTAWLEDKFTNFNVCHLLLDKISRMKIFEMAGESFDNVFLCSVNDYVRFMLSKFGISGDQILSAQNHQQSFRFNKLLISSNSFRLSHPAHYGASWALEYLRDHTVGSMSIVKPKKRLFVSRQSGNSRRIVNWKETEDFLLSCGFTIIEPHCLTPDEQINEFKEAEAIVGVHGAGLTNILFAPQQCKIIEILPPIIASPAYWILACGLEQYYDAYVALDSEGIEAGTIKGYGCNSRNVVVEIDQLKVIFDRAGIF